VAAPGAVSGWGLPQAGGGRICTGPDLRVTGQDRIFAVGDIALTEGQPLPQLAQPALQTGKHAADQVRRLAQGQPTVPFRYRDKGFMATIGYRSAVVQLPYRIRARGTLAWLAWLGLHLITLLGGRNRISALVNLSWRYLTWRHSGGLVLGEGMTGPAKTPSTPPAASTSTTPPPGCNPRGTYGRDHIAGLRPTPIVVPVHGRGRG
jgi:NADH dehydrogenase